MPSDSSSVATWVHSSRVGVSTSTRGCLGRAGLPCSRATAPMPKARVLPEPVGALPQTSRPAMASTTVAAWIGKGATMERRARASTMSAGTPRSAKDGWGRGMRSAFLRQRGHGGKTPEWPVAKLRRTRTPPMVVPRAPADGSPVRTPRPGAPPRLLRPPHRAASAPHRLAGGPRRLSPAHSQLPAHEGQHRRRPGVEVGPRRPAQVDAGPPGVEAAAQQLAGPDGAYSTACVDTGRGRQLADTAR